MITRYLILFFILSSLAEAAKCQKKDYFEGYIITQNSDTIRGLVSDRDSGPYQELYSKIRFIEDGTRKRKKYSPDQILGYGYDNSHFISIGLKEEFILFVNKYFVGSNYPKVFLKLIETNSHLTYYRKEFIHDDNQFLDDFPLFHINGSSQMVRVTQGLLGLKRKRLSEYFNDCPELVEKINQLEINTTNEVYDFYITSCQ